MRVFAFYFFAFFIFGSFPVEHRQVNSWFGWVRGGRFPFALYKDQKLASGQLPADGLVVGFTLPLGYEARPQPLPSHGAGHSRVQPVPCAQNVAGCGLTGLCRESMAGPGHTGRTSRQSEILT